MQITLFFLENHYFSNLFKCHLVYIETDIPTGPNDDDFNPLLQRFLGRQTMYFQPSSFEI